MKSKIAILLIVTALFSGCSAGRVNDIRAAAPKVLADAGFDIVAYEGYQYGTPGQS